MQLLGHIGGPSLDEGGCPTFSFCAWGCTPLQAGFWTSDLWAEAKPQILVILASVPSGILYKVLCYSESLPPQPQSTYCNADCTPAPGETGHHSPASVVVPLSAGVCQLPGYHIDQPHSWHAGGGWVPSPIFCKIQPRSTDDSVFWGVPEEISAVVCHTHHDWIWESLRKAPGCASWLMRSLLLPSLPPSGVLRWLIIVGSQNHSPSRSSVEHGVSTHELQCQMRAVRSGEGRKHQSISWGSWPCGAKITS